MHLTTRNVNTAFKTLVEIFHARGEWDDDRDVRQHIPVVRRPSRNGPVLTIDEPVTITYTHPKERVLFNQMRDANCFTNLYESLWMLAGRNDVTPLAYYTKNFVNYSDDGGTLNGAYGYRWRHVADKTTPVAHDCGDKIDQLDILVAHLKADPTSRRAVLQMWNVEDDLLKIGNKGLFTDVRPNGATITGSIGSKDVCCNTAVYFSVRPGEYDPEESCSPNMTTPHRGYLDITVTNRSNDLVWGCLGEDYVTFSFLQEYMAAKIGVEVGRYNQFTNNLHIYESNWKPDEWLAEYQNVKGNHEYDGYRGEGGIRLCNSIPLVKDPATFEQELPRFVETYSGEDPNRRTYTDYTEPFLANVATPTMTAFCLHKRRDYATALEYCERIAADDWRISTTQWILKRKEKYERRNSTTV